MSLSRRTLRTLCSPRLPLWLLGSFGVWFGIWAIRPNNWQDFILEHVLTVALLGFLCLTFRAFRLTNLSYLLVFTFMCLHVVGAHYTYALVPYDDWLTTAARRLGVSEFRLGTALGWERNHFDRLVHFAFGLLNAYPVREIFVRVVRARGFWSYYLPLDVVISFSAGYELLEWGVAVVFGGETAQAYLGTQGDVWDAHKDMLLATLGGLIAMLLTAGVHWRCRHDFASELADSLRPVDPLPTSE